MVCEDLLMFKKSALPHEKSRSYAPYQVICFSGLDELERYTKLWIIKKLTFAVQGNLASPS